MKVGRKLTRENTERINKDREFMLTRYKYKKGIISKEQYNKYCIERSNYLINIQIKKLKSKLQEVKEE